ncbi:MAG: hypothetical protein S4CHLAM20_00150 [Chlamydiia bacterium]|nr:hypothetical protein [Chlamydiia bacterium]
MSKIHTIGDSHCGFSFRGASDEDMILYPHEEGIMQVPLQVHYLGSRTMYSFGLRGCEEKDLEGIEKDDYLVFCFGEIDVRCHIYNQVHKNKRDLGEIMCVLVENYTSQIISIAKKLEITPVIFGITPPVKELTVEGYPSVGPFEERVKYTKLLNQTLEAKAKEKGILYFDVYNEYADVDGTLNMKYSDNLMHIGQDFNLPVKTKLCDLIWNHIQT